MLLRTIGQITQSLKPYYHHQEMSTFAELVRTPGGIYTLIYKKKVTSWKDHGLLKAYDLQGQPVSWLKKKIQNHFYFLNLYLR